MTRCVDFLFSLCLIRLLIFDVGYSGFVHTADSLFLRVVVPGQ